MSTDVPWYRRSSDELASMRVEETHQIRELEAKRRANAVMVAASVLDQSSMTVYDANHRSFDLALNAFTPRSLPDSQWRDLNAPKLPATPLVFDPRCAVLMKDISDVGYHPNATADKRRFQQKDVSLTKTYTEQEMMASMAAAELTQRETIGKRALIGVQEIYDSVKAGRITLPAGYIALKVLVEAIMPFCDPVTSQHISDVLEGWHREVKELERIEAEQVDLNSVVVVGGKMVLCNDF